MTYREYHEMKLTKLIKNTTKGENETIMGSRYLNMSNEAICAEIPHHQRFLESKRNYNVDALWLEYRGPMSPGRLHIEQLRAEVAQAKALLLQRAHQHHGQ